MRVVIVVIVIFVVLSFWKRFCMQFKRRRKQSIRFFITIRKIIFITFTLCVKDTMGNGYLPLV